MHDIQNLRGDLGASICPVCIPTSSLDPHLQLSPINTLGFPITATSSPTGRRRRDRLNVLVRRAPCEIEEGKQVQT